jgi:hypothetical protein
VIGFFAPRILIPEWLFEKLTRHELEQVVLHEAEHLRRGDDWTNLLQKLFLAVFPLNPALAFAERRLCREREMACDEGVVRRTQAPRAYAACLAGLAERHIEHRSEALSLGARAKALALNARAKALALNAFERRPELARRVHSILVRRNAIHPLAGRALLGAVACALVVGAVGLARCPQLVAFVPSAPKTATETAKLVPEGMRGDKVIAPSDEQSRGVGFRSINAMAIMPRTIAQRIASQPTVVHASCKQASNTSILRSAINAAQSMKSAAPAMVAGNAMAAAPTQQELVVFTTYEQVQATSDGLGDKVISDYDSETSASPRPTQTGPSQTGSGQFTITRLVFRIFPAGDNRTTAVPVVAARPETMPETSAKQGAQTASQTTDKPANQSAGQPANQATNQAAPGNPDPQTSQPKAISLGNGWFVIQL